MQPDGAGFPIKSVDPTGTLASLLPIPSLMGGIAYCGATITKPGHCTETGSLRRLVLGEPSGGESTRLQALCGVLAPMRIQIIMSRDIRADVWTKLLGNLGLNSVAALTLAPLDALLANPGTRSLVERMMSELLLVASATTGYVPPMTVSERLELSSRFGAYKPSTLQDVEAGRPLEVGALLGAVTELASRFGVSVPTIDTITALLDLRNRMLESASVSASGAALLSQTPPQK